MEGGKKTQPADHQLEQEEEAIVSPGAAAAAVAVAAAGAHDVPMQEGDAAPGEGADRPRLAAAAAIASDEALAHAMHMHELMETDELELRRRPFLGAARVAPIGSLGPDPFATLSSRARAGAGSSVDPFGIFSGAGAGASAVPRYVPPHARGAFMQPYTRRRARWVPKERGTTAIQRDALPPEREIGSVPRSVAPATTSRPGANTTDVVAASPTGQISLSRPAGASSSQQQVPGDKVAALPVPSETPPANVAASAGCTPPYVMAPVARPNVPADDAVSSKRRTLLADADSSVIFAGIEEVHDNGFYESIIRDAHEELEKMEDLGLHESLKQCVARSKATDDEHGSPTAAAVADGEEWREFSVEKFCEKWGITTSDIGPDEPGSPTERAPKVRPLADDEVDKFDCGICMETLDVFDLFHGGLPCKHKFCASCMSTYVEGRIRAGELPIPCPGLECKGVADSVLHPDKCKKAIDFAAFSDWGARLTERAIPPSRRTYCPNRRCGVMLETSGEERPAMAPCPACSHLLCAACGMAWSLDGSGEHDCAKGPDAALVKKLAEDCQWKQCPKCKMVVERIDGCRVMTCRCKSVFCYQCGLPMLRLQVQEGVAVCRCNDTGLAFAFAHHHQLHFFDAPVDQQAGHPPAADMAPQQQDAGQQQEDMDA